MPNRTALSGVLYSVIAALLLGGAWLVPNTLLSALLGCASVPLLLLSAESPRYRYSLLAGSLAIGIGFYWIIATLERFGGFPLPFAAFLFGLFSVSGALQFCIFHFLYRTLPKAIDTLALRGTLAWVFGELAVPRIFPWALGHTQLTLPTAQIAELGGVPLVTLVTFWLGESLYLLTQKERRQRSQIIGLLAFATALSFGAMRHNELSSKEYTMQNTSVVQANISTAKKHNIEYFLSNAARYHELSKPYDKPDTLIVWPETVIMEPIPTSIQYSNIEPRLPDPIGGGAYLLGTLTVGREGTFQNSAMGIYRDQKIAPLYHKQILMPFGEYIPLGEQFPWLYDYVPFEAAFKAGRGPTIMEFANGASVTKAAPLICYEDVLPSLSRTAVRAGANLLVNITNDAWFGNTHAPYQHHLIASFRAIETRRSLIRSTNTGLTALVNHLGETVLYIEPYSEQVLEGKLPILSEETLYTQIDSDLLMDLFVILLGCIALLFRWRESKQ